MNIHYIEIYIYFDEYWTRYVCSKAMKFLLLLVSSPSVIFFVSILFLSYLLFFLLFSLVLYRYRYRENKREKKIYIYTHIHISIWWYIYDYIFLISIFQGVTKPTWAINKLHLKISFVGRCYFPTTYNYYYYNTIVLRVRLGNSSPIAKLKLLWI